MPDPVIDSTTLPVPALADIVHRARGVETGGADLVVQLSGSDVVGWLEFADGALVAGDDGWRDDANLFVISPGDVTALLVPPVFGLGPSTAPRLDELVVGTIDEPLDPFPPFDLPGGLAVVDGELACMSIRLVLRDGPFGDVEIDLGVERGRLVAPRARVAGVARVARGTGPDRPSLEDPVDLTLAIPFDAFLAFASAAFDLHDLVGRCKIEGEPAYLFLAVALLDAPALRARLRSRSATAAALWLWCEHLTSTAWRTAVVGDGP